MLLRPSEIHTCYAAHSSEYNVVATGLSDVFVGYSEERLLPSLGAAKGLACRLVLTIEDPHRFLKTRDGGCFLGYDLAGGIPGRANHRKASAGAGVRRRAASFKPG